MTRALSRNRRGVSASWLPARSAWGHRLARRQRRPGDADPDAIGVFLATAHPAKFREVVEPAIGAVPLPMPAEPPRGRGWRPQGRRVPVQRRSVEADALRFIADGLRSFSFDGDFASLRIRLFDASVEVFRPGTGDPPARDAVPSRYHWDLTSICSSWDEWSALYRQLETSIEAFKPSRESWPLRRHAARGISGDGRHGGAELPRLVLRGAALRRGSARQRCNARRQQVQILFARQQQASSWFNPEILAIPIETDPQLDGADKGLAVYRFAIESLFHEQEHVLDEDGERLLSFAGRFNSVPYDSYSALTTADMRFPAITLRAGERVTLTYGQYRALLETNRRQEDRAAAYRSFHQTYADNQNTYRGAVQRRAPARLVPCAGARLREHARRRAAREQHSDVGCREPD